jgi:hypothetical protein
MEWADRHAAQTSWSSPGDINFTYFRASCHEALAPQMSTRNMGPAHERRMNNPPDLGIDIRTHTVLAFASHTSIYLRVVFLLLRSHRCREPASRPCTLSANETR